MSTAYSLTYQRALLDYEVATGGTFDGLSVILFQSPIDPTSTTVLADLEEADFAGYARVLTEGFGTAHNGPTGVAETVGDEASFVANAATTPNTIYGWGLVKEGSPDTLVCAEAFDAPVNIVNTGDGVTVIPIIRFGLNGTGLVA